MNNSIVLIFVLVFLAASCMVTIQAIKADSRTIVVPDDYPTIATAIENAMDGDVILVRKGTYDGPLNQTLRINKALSLIGEDANDTTIRLHPPWVESFIGPVSIGWSWANSIQILANDVVISGFTITSDGGYIVANGNRTQIIGNIITTPFRIYGSYQTFAHNVLTESIYPNGTINSYGLVESYGNFCRITDNRVSGTIAVYGSYNTIFANDVVGWIWTGFMTVGEGSSMVIYEGYSNLICTNSVRDSGGIELTTDANIVTNNTITNCSMGIEISSLGSDNTIFRNIITNCLGVGLYKTETGSNNIFYANYVANNFWGAKIAYAVLLSYNTATLYHNNFVNNAQQVNCDENETIIVAGLNFTRMLYHSGFFDNGSEGNYWSDYNGADANSDGIGDTPYVIDASRSDHYPLMAPFNVSSVTVQIPEWADITSPNPIPTPSFPPPPTPSPSPSPTPVIPETTPLAALAALVIVTCTVAIAIRTKAFRSYPLRQLTSVQLAE
jgi:parallel beta-helix repeat protein